jgi:3-dehydroquinate dehydratase II
LAPKFLALNGPNLGRLGKREPSVYGTQTLADIERLLIELGTELGVRVECRQSNHEGDLIDWIGASEDDGFAGVLINPGAYTHTSWALHDCIKGNGLPVVEVHLSNPAARDAFRHKSCVAPVCIGTIAGFGVDSYRLALRALIARTPTEPATTQPPLAEGRRG